MPRLSSFGVVNAINFGLASSKKIYDYIIVGGGSPYLSGYSFTAADGYNTLISAPSVAPTVAIYNLVINKQNNAIICSDSGSTLFAYKWAAGFGTKFADPSVLTSSCTSVRINNESNTVFAKGGGTIIAYAWTNASGFGAKYANPATAPANAQQPIAVNSNSTSFAVIGESANPWISGYNWSGGFGAKFTNPSTSIFAYPNDINVVGSSDLIITNSSSDSFHAYMSNSSGFGTKYANPPTITPKANIFTSTPTNDALLYTPISGSTAISAISWTSGVGFGTKYTNPTYIDNTVYSLSVNSTGKAVTFGKSVSPYIGTYAWDSITGFGTKYTDPSSPLPFSPNSITFQK